MKVTKLKEFPRIDESCRVKVCYTGTKIEVVYSSSENNSPVMRKWNADQMVNTKTGELIDCNRSGWRSESLYGVRTTLAMLRRIINLNVPIPEKARWLTLTYAEHMTDTVRLKKDSNNFYKRLDYYCEKKSIPMPDYITVVEPQESGSWHLHIILIWKVKAPFIEQAEYVRLWGLGSRVWITAIRKDVDNIGAYFSAYLANIPADDLIKKGQISDTDPRLVECETYEGKKMVPKKVLKGARLALYPSGINIYRTSRGIVIPEFEESNMKAVHEKTGFAGPVFSSCSLLEDEETGFHKTIIKEYYNTSRHTK